MSSQDEEYIKKLEETNFLLQKKLDEFRQTPHPDCEKLMVSFRVDPMMLGYTNIDMIRDKIERNMMSELGKRMNIVSFTESYSGTVVYRAEIWVMKECK